MNDICNEIIKPQTIANMSFATKTDSNFPLLHRLISAQLKQKVLITEQICGLGYRPRKRKTLAGHRFPFRPRLVLSTRDERIISTR